MLSWRSKLRPREGVVGFSLESDGVAMARVVHAGSGRPRLAACDSRACSDPGRLGSALAEMVRAGRLSGCASVAVLPPPAYGLWLLDAPDVETEEMADAVRWMVQDLIDYPADDAVTDYFEFPDYATRGRKRVYVVASRAERVQAVLDAASQSGLSLGPIDITELALRNVSERLGEGERGRALLQLRPRRGLLTLTRGHDLLLTRGLEVGLEALRASRSPAPLGELALEGEGREQRDALLLEVQRSLDYFESQLGQPPVEELVLAPLEQPTPGILEFLEKNLVARVRPFDLSELIEFDEPVPEEVQARCLAAVGAALRTESSER